MENNILSGYTDSTEKQDADNSFLDLAFAMDCTLSMGPYIESARNNIRQIVEEIVSREKSDVALALVEYRDHPPEETTFVTRVNDFTNSVSKMKQWLEACWAYGGGDEPEAVADALHALTKLHWRSTSTKICVLISDAPPHGLTQDRDGFPNGCPQGFDPMKIVRQLAERGITLYAVGCEPAISPYTDFFSAIAYITGGQYIPLSRANLLSQVIVSGAGEELSLEKLLEEVGEEVCLEASSKITIDEDELSARLHKKMKLKGVRTKQIRLNNDALASISRDAIQLSGLCDMEAVREKFTPSAEVEVPKIILSSPLSTKLEIPRLSTHSPMTLNRMGPTAFSPHTGFNTACESVNVTPVDTTDSYTNVEDEISYNQVQRMVRKKVMQKQLKKN